MQTPTPRPRFIRIRKGLDLPIAGAPEQRIHDANAVSRVALVGTDYHSVKRLPTLEVKEGDRVRAGQPLFRGKTYTEVVFTAPASGVVEAIHRGPRRVVETVVLRLEGDQAETFNRYNTDELHTLNYDQVRENLLASGLWLALRTRPFGMVANPNDRPSAVFVTAMDTLPLAPDPRIIIADAAEDFRDGLRVISRLSEGPTWVCAAADAEIPLPENPRIREARFSGPHPAGLVGTHIHHLHPAGLGRTVWHLHCQDVIAIGRLFTGGTLDPRRVIALAGPMVRKPRLVRTQLGACTNELLRAEVFPGQPLRVISGSVLGGRHAVGHTAFLSRYFHQLTVLAEPGEREFMGWAMPGRDKFSLTRAFLRSLVGGPPIAMNTSYNGSPRALVPIGGFEEVMPLDILATPLLRALLVDDSESAEALGALELDEEDLALCSYVDPGKHDFGPILRRNLRRIWRENQ